MKKGARKCPGCRREYCDGCGIFQRLNTNKQLRVQFPAGFEIEPENGLGISFDVGTTTLAGMLWDLKEGTLLEAETAGNPQAVFGADVISRVQAAVESREDFEKLQRLLQEKLDEMAAEMIRRLSERGDLENTGAYKVRKVTIAGNTAMCEILMNISPKGLVKAPFSPDYNGVLRFLGESLGFCFLKEAMFLFLPPIGGYVGADALAVHCWVSFQKKERNLLVLDIGTNGEILLLCGKQKYACSAAAGPALEGGGVSCGMRAAVGAIDMVSLGGRFPQQDIVCRVIGGEAPAGICGSGLIEALALLYQIGVLDDTGYMRDELEARRAGVPEKVCRRIENHKGGKRFLLTDSAHPVYLLPEDIRQLQLAVSAMRSGIEILLKKAGIEAGLLDRIYLAGAFGCYISIKSSISIGLLPDIPGEKIHQAGNLAGTGAAMALLSEKVLRSMEEESGDFVHVELAEEEEFKERFLAHMNFPLKNQTIMI